MSCRIHSGRHDSHPLGLIITQDPRILVELQDTQLLTSGAKLQNLQGGPVRNREASGVAIVLQILCLPQTLCRKSVPESRFRFFSRHTVIRQELFGLWSLFLHRIAVTDMEFMIVRGLG